MPSRDFDNPDYLEIADIERRRRLAASLQAQSLAPLPDRMVGRVAVRTSPLEGAARIAQALAGSYIDKQADTAATGLSDKRREKTAAWLRVMPPGTTETARTDQEGTGAFDMAGSAGPKVTSTPASPQQYLKWMGEGVEQGVPQSALHVGQMGAQMAQQDALQRQKGAPGGQLAHLDPRFYTPESWSQYIGSGDSRALRAAVLPGQQLSADVGRERLTQQKKFWEGLSADQKNKAAIKLAELGIDITKLGWETGQNVPMPTLPVPLTPQPGGQNPLQSSLQISPDVQAQRDAEAGRLRAAEGQPGGGGLIPSANVLPAGPRNAAEGTPPLVPNRVTLTPKEQQKLEIDRPIAARSLSSVNNGIDRMLANVDQVEGMPGLSHITGPYAGRTPNLTGKATNAQAILDTLKSQIGVEVLQAMRDASKTGGAVGNVTEKEWPILQNQLAALQQAQETGQFKEQLTALRGTLARIKQTASRAYEDTYGAAPKVELPAPTEKPQKAKTRWSDL